MLNPALDIGTYVVDGFAKVCDVEPNVWQTWLYKNIDESLMYSSHRSWVYMIVDNKEIVKVGETSKTLGLRQKKNNQPKTGSKSRLGRYREGDTTDAVIRGALEMAVSQGRVSIWARQCQMHKINLRFNGQEDEAMTTCHEDIEKKYLDLIFSAAKRYPRLNKRRA